MPRVSLAPLCARVLPADFQHPLLLDDPMKTLVFLYWANRSTHRQSFTIPSVSPEGHQIRTAVEASFRNPATFRMRGYRCSEAIQDFRKLDPAVDRCLDAVNGGPDTSGKPYALANA